MDISNKERTTQGIIDYDTFSYYPNSNIKCVIGFDPSTDELKKELVTLENDIKSWISKIKNPSFVELYTHRLSMINYDNIVSGISTRIELSLLLKDIQNFVMLEKLNYMTSIVMKGVFDSKRKHTITIPSNSDNHYDKLLESTNSEVVGRRPTVVRIDRLLSDHHTKLSAIELKESILPPIEPIDLARDIKYLKKQMNRAKKYGTHQEFVKLQQEYQLAKSR